MSFATTRERFGEDARRCEQSCPGRSRLFAHRNPGEAVADMIDLQGRRYRDLPTAFLHATQYVVNCTCRGNPWDAEARARNREYAEAAAKKPPDRSAAQRAVAPRRAERQSRRMRAYRNGRGDDD
jgi:hypothetical protein